MEQTVSNLPIHNVTSEVLPAYVRVIDFSEEPELRDLMDYQNVDLAIWEIQEQEGEMGPYLTMTVSQVRDLTEEKFLVNCGGESVIKKVKHAFSKIAANEIAAPVVAAFHRKMLAGGSRSFWVVS